MYEITSDSDDDCYIKFPQKLQRLKNKQALNNVLRVVDNSANDNLDDSIEVSLISKQDSGVISESNIDLTDFIPNELNSPFYGISTRSRRNKRKNSDIQWSPVPPTQKGGKRGRGKGKSRGKGSQTSVPSTLPPRDRDSRRGRGIQSVRHYDSTIVSLLTPSPRRSNRSRRRGTQQTPLDSQSIVTYSIGNTDEYPDASDHQTLFSNKNFNTDIPSPIIDLDESLNNEELSVKVYWQHSEVFKFNIRRLQKLTQIFDFFVNKGVSREHLLFTYNYKNKNKILRPDDTPESIDYNIAKFIEGGMVNKQFSLNPSDTPKKNGFIVKFQCQGRKKPVELSVGKDEKLQLAMVKCAEHLEIPIAKLVFEFDGESIQGNQTPSSLDMESGDCIDVKIINVN